jgi:hypothetical protein
VKVFLVMESAKWDNGGAEDNVSAVDSVWELLDEAAAYAQFKSKASSFSIYTVDPWEVKSNERTAAQTKKPTS